SARLRRLQGDPRRSPDRGAGTVPRATGRARYGSHVPRPGAEGRCRTCTPGRAGHDAGRARGDALRGRSVMTEASSPASPDARADGFSVELPMFAGPFRLLAERILEQKV